MRIHRRKELVPIICAIDNGQCGLFNIYFSDRIDDPRIDKKLAAIRHLISQYIVKGANYRFEPLPRLFARKITRMISIRAAADILLLKIRRDQIPVIRPEKQNRLRNRHHRKTYVDGRHQFRLGKAAIHRRKTKAIRLGLPASITRAPIQRLERNESHSLLPALLVIALPAEHLQIGILRMPTLAPGNNMVALHIFKSVLGRDAFRQAPFNLSQ